MHLSTGALCTWHWDKLVCGHIHFQHIPHSCELVCLKDDLQLHLLHKLTSTASKRCCSSSSGGIGIFSPLVCFWEPGEDGAVLLSFPWGVSTLPAAFPMSAYPVVPKNTHTNKTLNDLPQLDTKRGQCCASSYWGRMLRLCEVVACDLLFQWSCSVHLLMTCPYSQTRRKHQDEIHPCLWKGCWCIMKP